MPQRTRKYNSTIYLTIAKVSLAFAVTAILIAGVFWFFDNAPAFAQPSGQDEAKVVEQKGIVPCTGVKQGDGEIRCTVCHLYEGMRRIMSFLLFVIALPAAVIAIIAGGAYWLLSAGSPERISKGKDILWWAFIGFIVAFAAWVIINTLLDTIGFKLPAPSPSEWNNFNICNDLQENFFGSP